MPKTFNDYNLKEFIIKNLENVNITNPSQVQDKTIPLVLKGHDVIGKAKTGTGKTFSYLLPMIQNINPDKRDLQMLVLAPSKELCMQILREAKNVTENTQIRVEALVEGMNLDKQLEKLKQKPHLLIATPGRLVHVIGLKKIKMHEVSMISLDEVDQVLEKGALDKVLSIIKTIPSKRQLLSFSASISKESIDTLNKLMNDPIYINLDKEKPIPNKINHKYLISSAPKKTDTLEELLNNVDYKKCLIFINKNENVDRFVKGLSKKGFKIEGIQTRTKNQDRARILSAFENSKLNILVTTDIFTRGMDFKDVTHIFNMDLPLNNIDYLHRAGRTGRMDKDGLVINIVRNSEKFIMYKMMKSLNIKVDEVALVGGKITDVVNIISKKNNKKNN